MKQIENVFWANTENWFSSIANLSRLLGGWMRMGGEVGGEGEYGELLHSFVVQWRKIIKRISNYHIDQLGKPEPELDSERL